MKKTLTLISIITLISFYAKAQDSEPKDYVKSYIALIGGLSNPMGNFSQKTYENNQAGFAKRGATFGLEGAVYVYKNLAIGALISFQDQGELTTPDVQLLANGYNNVLKVNSTLVQGVNRYHNLNFMGGPQYSFTYGKFILDLRVDAGLIKSSSTPQLTIYVSKNNTSQTITQNSSTGSAFAYGGKAGLRWAFADGWDIGVRFNYVKSDGIKISTTGDVSALGNTGRIVTKQPISEIQSTFGIGVHF
ncbi:outer membrane beta-barrel protein [Mucilaginibacter sp. OK098]|uniref:outer membrane beta-barrel protein n=1 Tax=Mucilaginibacter sp. OK098 TaxID=1855297 RepID=UPI0009208309|nr:outer membrane beta-barrel protein [Mucilaginibacter sp. OK098]SHN27700.1 Outer membrane protein beta-barrel domain-containing protein [Mucilaginibacter sp. OK098]